MVSSLVTYREFRCRRFVRCFYEGVVSYEKLFGDDFHEKVCTLCVNYLKDPEMETGNSFIDKLFFNEFIRYVKKFSKIQAKRDSVVMYLFSFVCKGSYLKENSWAEFEEFTKRSRRL